MLVSRLAFCTFVLGALAGADAFTAAPLSPIRQHAVLSARSAVRKPAQFARVGRSSLTLSMAAADSPIVYSSARMPANPDKEKCACGSGLTYRRCCSGWHERGEAPVDPIILIRTRYSAFAYCLPEYLRATTSKESPEFTPRTDDWNEKLTDFCKSYTFKKLSGEVLGVSIENCQFWSQLRANIVFKARMLGDDNKLIEFWERAILVRASEEDGWRYLKGDLLEHTGPLY